VGAPLHRVPGAAGPGRALTSALRLLVSPDDYLLELERSEAEAAWLAASPEGELQRLDPAPPPARLIRELGSPSLFATARLIVVPDARPYLGEAAEEEENGAAGESWRGAGEVLAAALGEARLVDVALILAAVSNAEPSGPLVEVVRRRGTLTFLPLPAPPKPWEEVRVTPAQRRVLEDVIRRVAPAVLADPDTVEALCECYGFRPRRLAQVAEQLQQTGTIGADAVRADWGAGESSLKDLEEALLRRNPAATARFVARLAAGGSLSDWWGKPIEGDAIGRRVALTVARLLRQALAVRGHVRLAGLERELDPRRCGAPSWYNATFRRSILEPLQKGIAGCSDSPLEGSTAWQLHRAFKLGAAYDDAELLRALAALAGSGAERARRPQALAALAPALLELVSAGAAPAARTAAGG
jgi:hypothetical protein